MFYKVEIFLLFTFCLDLPLDTKKSTFIYKNCYEPVTQFNLAEINWNNALILSI